MENYGFLHADGEFNSLFCNAVVLNQGSIEPLGFDEAVSGVPRERPLKH